MDDKKYFLSLRNLILFALFVFLFSSVYGYIGASQNPEQAIQALEQFEKIFGSILDYSPIIQLILIFLNNLVSLLLTIILGIVFGFYPVLALFSNGSLLGIFAYLWSQEMPLNGFFAGIIPHGIIEIPILLIGAGIGLRLGRMATEKFFLKIFPNWTKKNIKAFKDSQGKEIRKKKFRQEFKLGIKFALKYLTPLLFIAGIIEIFITPLFF